MQGGPGPGGLPLPPLRSFAGLRESPIFNEATFQVLLERVGHLEQYKAHLEKENKEMHQQLQVLSGFLNVVATSVRTTENMLFSSPGNSPREAAPPPVPGNLGPTSSNSQQALAGMRRKAPGPPGVPDDLPAAAGGGVGGGGPAAAAAAAAAAGAPLASHLGPGPGAMGPGAAGLKRPRLDAGPLTRPPLPMDPAPGLRPPMPMDVGGPPLRPPMPLMPPMLPPPRAGMGGPFGGGGAGQTSLRLTRVQGTSALNGDPVSIYRIEVLRDGFFDKYLYLPNDSIVLYGLRVWQHREAIPNEIIKMVENCLTTRSVASEQLTEEVRQMKTILSQQCPHLTRWGWGSNKVRLVSQMGLRDLVSRIHRTMQKNSQVALPSLADGYLAWLDDPQAPQVPARAWTAPVYSRRPPNEEPADTPPPSMAAAAVAAATAAAAAAQAVAAAGGGAGPPPLSPMQLHAALGGMGGPGGPLPGPGLLLEAPLAAADGGEAYRQLPEGRGRSPSDTGGGSATLVDPEPLPNGTAAAAEAGGAGRVGSASSLTTASDPAVGGAGHGSTGRQGMRRQGTGPSVGVPGLDLGDAEECAPQPDSSPTPEEDAVEAEAAAGLTALGATAPLRLPVRHSTTDSAPGSHTQQQQPPPPPVSTKRGAGGGGGGGGAPYSSPTAAMAAAAAAAAAASGLDPCALALDASTWLAQLNQFASQFGITTSSQPQHSSAQ